MPRCRWLAPVALFFIQVVATLEFAVLYSTLVLYTTRHLQFSAKEATATMGIFGAFNCSSRPRTTAARPRSSGTTPA